MRQYIDSCRTLEILKQDSGLLPKPKPTWNVFTPKEGDIAHVDENNSDYIFKSGEWKLMEEENNEN